MKTNPILFSITLLFFVKLFLVACRSDSSTGPTTVYLVRHAEKDLTDPSSKNPPLTPAGAARAQHLADKLRSVFFDAIYSTAFDRNRNTVGPLATEQKLTVNTYEWHDLQGIQKVLKENQGKTLLICGHGDNLLPIIKNAGAKPPLDSLGTYEYDKLFKLTISPAGTASATVETFN